ncbi:MAG TPA: FmdB family zinc ribbon protein [Acidimicrobiales bacterium]
MTTGRQMPTYEYRCEACANTFDIVQGFADSPLTTCDVCGGALRKVYAPVGIVFKGSGFYKTDSRTSSSSSRGAGAKDSGGEAGSKDAAKSDSKSDSKPDSKSDSKSDSASAPASEGSKNGAAKPAAAAAPRGSAKD